MSSLRNKINRSRSSNKQSTVEESLEADVEANNDGNVEVAAAANINGEEENDNEEESEHEHSSGADNNADDDKAKKRKGGKKQQGKKEAPVKKNDAKTEENETPQDDEEEEEDEFGGPPTASEKSEDSDHRGDEDYHEESNDDDDDDDASYDDDDDDDDVGYSKKRRAPARRKGSRSSPRKKKAVKKTRTSTRKSRAKAAPKSSEEERYDNNDDDDDDESFGSDETPTPRRRLSRRSSDGGRRASPRNKKKAVRTSYKDIGSSGDDNSDNENQNDSYTKDVASLPFKRTKRSAASRATAKIHEIQHEKHEESSDENDDEPKKKRKKKDPDDEEFDIDDENLQKQEQEDADLDDDHNSSGDESFLKGVHSVPSETHAAIGNADSGLDFDDERSSDGDEKKQPQQDRRKTARKTSPAALEHYHSHSDSDDSKEIAPTPTKKRLSQEERNRLLSRKSKSKSSPPKLPKCPSKIDQITLEPLPDVHVCFVSPDGESRHCFALETLHKVATMSPHPQYRTNLSGQQQLTFLQPPHFRSAMSEDLLDQIASRFGRQALDLKGDFYNRSKASIAVEDDEDDYRVNYTEAHTDMELFRERWIDYQVKTMGSQDLYPCPVCYAVAHHQLESTSDDEEDAVGAKKPIPLPEAEYSYDPMTVLGSPDNNDFEIAAAFCFKKISEVKHHLREDHHCKTAKIDNEVFMRYKVRKPDGLLQRYLAKAKVYSKRPQQGDMRRYWYDGNSELFIYLLYQLQELKRYKESHNEENETDESDDDDHNPLTKAMAFFQSFADRAEDLWERIVAPFSNANEDEMENFVNDNEEEEAEDGYPHRSFDAEQAAITQREIEEQARYYREQAERASDDDGSSRYEDEDDDLHIPNDGLPSSESEEDEWVSGIRNKKRRTSSAGTNDTPARTNGNAVSRPQNGGHTRLSGLKAKRRNSIDSDSSVEHEMEASGCHKQSSTRRAILDDDSD